MRTKFVEVTNAPEGINWGKFLIAEFDADEWARPEQLAIDEGRPNGRSLLAGRGWGGHHRLIVDLQTGEGAIFSPGGYAHADLEKHAVWVCPMFEPFLTHAWRFVKDGGDLFDLPDVVRLTEAEAPSEPLDAIDRAYLTREEADAEVARVAAAVQRSRRFGSSGCYDRGLTVIEVPTGGHVEVDARLYLARFLAEQEADVTDGPEIGSHVNQNPDPASEARQ